MAASTASTAASTEGQRLLLAVPDSLSVVAGKVGCSKALAGYWRQGAKVPSPTMRAKLEAAYGIAPAAWELAPGAAPPEPATAAGDEEEPELEAVGTDTLALTNAQLAEIRRALRNKGLSEAARSKKEDTYAKLLALKARLEREQELVEDRIVREHPMWRRIRERIVEAVRPYPDAAKAIVSALEELEA